jgi:glycosyltransferase involved in cell wall biosynthesis
MHVPERSVLHVLPHPNGGGETYVDALESMEGYVFARLFLGPKARPSAALASGLLRALREVRRHDLVHVHGEAAAGLCLPALATHASVVTLHGLHLVRRLHGLALRAAEAQLALVVTAASRTICVSDTERAVVTELVGPSRARRVITIPNGVSVNHPRVGNDRTRVRAELGIPEPALVGIWVGALDARKDPLTAIRAAEEASTALLVVGDGPLRSQVERAAGNAIRVLGAREDIPALLRSADFFVLSSSREGLAFSLLEAMATGLPPVVTDLPENLEVIGETIAAAGMAVRVGGVPAFAAAFARLRDARTREELGAEAIRRVAEHFRADDMIARTRRVYDDVLRRQRV